MKKIVYITGNKFKVLTAKKILEPLNIPGTFNITTGYILKEINEQDKPGPHEPMSIEEIKELSSNSIFEIAGHGYTHDNDINNLVLGVIKLTQLNIYELVMILAGCPFLRDV